MSWWMLALRLTGMGWYVALCIVIGVAGGVGLDRLLGTKAVFLLVGVVLGTILAFWGLYKMVQPFLSNYGDKTRRPDLNGGDT